MEAAAWFGLFGGSSLVLAIGIAIGVSRSRGKDLDALGDRVHRLTNRVNVFPEKPDEIYVRKETMASELKSIHDSLTRIEKHQEMMAQRFMNGGAGMGA